MEQFLAALGAMIVFFGIIAVIGVGVFIIGLTTGPAGESKPKPT